MLIIVPDHHQSFGYVFGETVNASGYGSAADNFSSPAFWFVFGLGLLLSQYTITGFDASAHTAEETQKASRMAAVGMYMSVVVSVVFGWILLLAVTFAIPSTEGALENIGVVVPWIWTESMSQNWAEVLLFICVVAQFFCLTASVTSASRMMFAFSRDRAVPGTSSGGRCRSTACPQHSVSAIGVALRGAHDARRSGTTSSATGVGTGDRGDRPLHRVHPSRLSCGFRLGDSWDAPGRLEPRQALQVDRHRSPSSGSR